MCFLKQQANWFLLGAFQGFAKRTFFLLQDKPKPTLHSDDNRSAICF